MEAELLLLLAIELSKDRLAARCYTPKGHSLASFLFLRTQRTDSVSLWLLIFIAHLSDVG